MKKFIIIPTVIWLILQSFAIGCCALDVSAHSAFVIDGDSGLTVYEKNADAKMGMASTTKIMTCIVAIENCNLEKDVSVSDKAIGVEGSSIYLQKGETLTMKQLLYALMLQSANDAATAIACEISGSTEEFAVLMNEKAKSLGLKNTHFTNPHGLYDENHYTTARELALITKHALENPTFREIVSTIKTTIPLNNDEGVRALVNHNKLLRIYDGAIGVKTGF
ncbi:MAG: D-alanyl-D-alanine carboxypeptidase, partial [Clostridia bacterium]|nr:D-alanyl-D-alanine carboxypeptidase [Clostridia bacterium]